MNNITTSYSSQTISPQFFEKSANITNEDFEILNPIKHWRCYCFFGAVARKPMSFVDYETGELITQFLSYSKRIYYPFGINKEGKVQIGSLTPVRGDFEYTLKRYKESKMNRATDVGIIAKNNNPYVVIEAIKDRGESFPRTLAEELKMSFWIDSQYSTIAIGKINPSLKNFRMQLGIPTDGYSLYLNHAIKIPTHGEVVYFGERKMNPDDIISRTQKSLDYRIAITNKTLYSKPPQTIINATTAYRENNWKWGIKHRPDTFNVLESKLKPSEAQIKAILFHSYDKALNVSEFDHSLIAGLMWNTALEIIRIFDFKRISDEKIQKWIDEVVLGYIDFRTSTDSLLDLHNRRILKRGDFTSIKNLTLDVNLALTKIATLSKYGYLTDRTDKASFSPLAIRRGLEDLKGKIDFEIKTVDNYKKVNFYIDQNQLDLYLHSLSE